MQDHRHYGLDERISRNEEDIKELKEELRNIGKAREKAALERQEISSNLRSLTSKVDDYIISFTDARKEFKNHVKDTKLLKLSNTYYPNRKLIITIGILIGSVLGSAFPVSIFLLKFFKLINL